MDARHGYGCQEKRHTGLNDSPGYGANVVLGYHDMNQNLDWHAAKIEPFALYPFAVVVAFSLLLLCYLQVVVSSLRRCVIPSLRKRISHQSISIDTAQVLSLRHTKLTPKPARRQCQQEEEVCVLFVCAIQIVTAVQYMSKNEAETVQQLLLKSKTRNIISNNKTTTPRIRHPRIHHPRN